MRLSEAILAGSVLIPKTAPGNIDMCAIGMAIKALGLPTRTDLGVNYNALFVNWPWTERADLPKPCDCAVAAGEPVYVSIYHIFDSHIFDPYYDWTLDQLCQWVDSVDPTPKETVEESQAVEEVEKVLA